MIFGFWGVLFLCYCNSEDNLTASQDGVLQWLNLGCFMILETEWCLILFLKLGLTYVATRLNGFSLRIAWLYIFA